MKKIELMEKLKRKFAEIEKNPFFYAGDSKVNIKESPKENFAKNEDLEDFKEKLRELEAEINKELKVSIRKKPLVERSALFLKNSSKETESQRRSEEKLKRKNEKKEKFAKTRNYNVKK